MLFSVRSALASPSYSLLDPPGGPTDRRVAYLRLPSSRPQVCSDTLTCGVRVVGSCTSIHCMATRPLTNAGTPVLTGTDHAPSTRYLFVRRPLCFYDATVVLAGHTQFRPFLCGTPILPTRDSPRATSSAYLVPAPPHLARTCLYSGAGGPPTRPASGRLYPGMCLPLLGVDESLSCALSPRPYL